MSVNDYESWLEVARHDVDSADLLIRGHGHADIIIYHLHQAVEKYFKAILVKSGINPPKIHQLDKLMGMVVEIDPDVQKVTEDVVRLEQFQPKIRYPSGDKISYEDALDCWDRMKKIANCLKVFRRHRKLGTVISQIRLHRRCS